MLAGVTYAVNGHVITTDGVTEQGGYLVDVLQNQGCICNFQISEGCLTNYEISGDIWHFT
jgi:hypothetical protein